MCAEEEHASLSRNLDILAAKHVRLRLDPKQALRVKNKRLARILGFISFPAEKTETQRSADFYFSPLWITCS